MTIPLGRPAPSQHDTFETRWTRWQEAGAAQDRTWNRRAAAMAAVALVALAAWLALSLYLA